MSNQILFNVLLPRWLLKWPPLWDIFPRGHNNWQSFSNIFFHIWSIIHFHDYAYSLLRPFLFFTTNQFAQRYIFLANLITYFVNICNIY